MDEHVKGAFTDAWKLFKSYSAEIKNNPEKWSELLREEEKIAKSYLPEDRFIRDLLYAINNELARL